MILSEDYIKQLEKKDRFLEVINRFAIQLLDCQTVDMVVWTLAKHAIAELGYEDCVVYLFDEKGEFLVQKAAHGPKNPIDLNILNPIKLKLGEGIVGHVALRGVPEIVKDTRIDSRYIMDDDMRLSEIAVPIIHDGEVIGVIDSEHPEKEFYTNEDLDILTTIASMSASKIVQAQYLQELTTYKNELEELVKMRTLELEEIVIEVENQKQEISLKNKDLLDGMGYARRIQKSILPSVDQLHELFETFFLFFKPKEIVSGDFYWVKKQGDILHFAVADCTGHGVPGALLSIMGYNALNTVTIDKEYSDPGELLLDLRNLIVENLKNVNEQQIHDGMDISLCSYHFPTQTLKFAGANNPVVIVRDNQIIELEGDKQSIGFQEEYLDFVSQEIKVRSGDCVYLFSDGYKDQFGGSKQKKFKYGNFKDLLLRCTTIPSEDRKSFIQNHFSDWTATCEQVDDVCLLGIEF